MSGRAGQLGRAEQLRIGRLVLAARAEGALWKQLAFRFGRSEAQLWRYLSLASGAQSARCKTSSLASECPRMKEWLPHQVAGALLADRARSGAQPARHAP